MPWGFRSRCTGARVFFAVLFLLLIAPVHAAVVLERTPSAAGAMIPSSWVDPDGSDADEYAYDSFVLGADRSITEVRWRGGYIHGYPLPNGSKDVVTDFRITFYATNQTGNEPLCGNPHLTETVFLADYRAGSNAGEMPAGTFGGKEMFDYAYALPAPFTAKAGVKYWIKVEASLTMYADWGIAVGTGAGTGEDSLHYQFSSGDMRFRWGTGDGAFTLLDATPEPYSMADVSRALTLWAGLDQPAGNDLSRLDVEVTGASANVIDACDALRIARKAAGLEPNP